jgi:hypothetical protein
METVRSFQTNRRGVALGVLVLAWAGAAHVACSDSPPSAGDSANDASSGTPEDASSSHVDAGAESDGSALGTDSGPLAIDSGSSSDAALDVVGAVCVPGQVTCSGATLRRCTDAGSGYTETSCATPELCAASTNGHCADPACGAGDSYCGTSLPQCLNAAYACVWRCKSTQTGYELWDSCTKCSDEGGAHCVFGDD